MSRQLRPSPNCLNCGVAVGTRFCPECGQENTTYRVSLGRLLGDLFEELFQIESRLWRTLATLFRRPGLLTVEYNAGRRVRYTTPLRLYLIASVAYFFIAGVMPGPRHGAVQMDLGNADQLHAELSKVPAAGWKRKLFERLEHAARNPDTSVTHARALLAEWLPRVMAVIVPLFALMTMVLFRRPRLYFVEHLVFALHVHAVGFLLTIPMTLVGGALTTVVVFAGDSIWTALAARRVFQQSWWSTIWKLTLAAFVYATIVGLVVAGVMFVGMLTS